MKARCGAWMANVKEPCARKSGHKRQHRSAYAMENDNRASKLRHIPEVWK